jgi:Flp pilus assembly protein TadD
MPTEIDSLLQSAVVHHNAGRLGEAERLYRQILSRQPRHADALNLLGVIAGQTGHPEIAVDLINQAIAVQPDTPLFLQNLAESLRRLGRLEEAAVSMRRLVELNPNSPTWLYQLADLLRETKQYREALARYDQFLQISPHSAEAHNNRGGCLMKLFRHDEAIQSIRGAIELNPQYAEAHNNLGICLQNLATPSEAIALRPDDAQAFSNLTAAIAGFRKAIELRPDYAEAHHNLSMALLVRGDYDEGWRKMEWRFKTADFPGFKTKFEVPQWDGQDLHGRTILLHCEQGLGDSIQFIRYAPILVQRGASVIVWTPAELERLFRSLREQFTIFASGALPRFAFHSPLLSLPRGFKTQFESIPRGCPYLFPEPALTAEWQRKLEDHGNSLKVGLIWAGRPEHANDQNRSAKLKTYTALWKISGVSFFSLQKGEAASQIADANAEMKIVDLGKELHDLADTAAVIANLDLVISIDSAIAHLAGALGKPVWVMLPFAPDWRWLLDRQDTPWYPTMRLFRQKAAGDWSAPIEQIAAALAALANP